MPAIDDILNAATVIPVMEIADAGLAAPLAQALERGGLKVLELTMRTPAALDALSEMKRAAPGLYVGMGTILSPVDAERSVRQGADFLVSPGLTNALRAFAQASPAPLLPGVATAGEIMEALDAGLPRLKFFPAEPAGGVAYLKSLQGPLPHAKFCPTGGIAAERVADYLALPNVMCVGGSWIATPALIAAKDWGGIEANARRAAGMKKK